MGFPLSVISLRPLQSWKDGKHVPRPTPRLEIIQAKTQVSPTGTCWGQSRGFVGELWPALRGLPFLVGAESHHSTPGTGLQNKALC
jgi:hypothetical protein